VLGNQQGVPRAIRRRPGESDESEAVPLPDRQSYRPPLSLRSALALEMYGWERRKSEQTDSSSDQHFWIYPWGRPLPSRFSLGGCHWL